MKSYPARQAQLREHSSWIAVGAVSATQANTHFQASMHWQQQSDNHYHIRFFGPLGLGQANIDYDGKQVFFTDHKHRYQAQTPESLLENQLGIQLPVNDLQYWILGAVAPNQSITHMTLDPYNRLQSLDQEGWHIEYLAFTNVDGVELPQRIRLSQAHTQVKLAIDRWDIPNLKKIPSPNDKHSY